jgi:signal peptidase I
VLIIIALVVLAGGMLIFRAGLKILGAVVSIVGVVLLVALVLLALTAKAYRIPSESMTDTLEVGDRVIALEITDPGVGDVAVFNPPSGAVENTECGVEAPAGTMCSRPTRSRADVTFVQRVVARAGDTVALQGGRLVRNGKRVDEPYAEPCDGDGCDFPQAITVPRGHVFVLGDNRGGSADSRFWGPLPARWLKGKVVARYWPAKRAGGV